jgi:hypothetical protein
MMKKQIVVWAVVTLVLAGCGDSHPTLSTEAEGQSATIAPEPPKIEHMYSMKDGDQYGYEKGISKDQQDAGQTASTLLMFSYAGEKDGVYQAYTGTDGVVTVMQCNNPCEFMKILTFVGGENVKTDRMKATEGSVGWAVMSDAINGKLEPHVAKRNGKKGHVWFDENSGIHFTPS